MSGAIYCIPNNCEAPALRAEIERLQATLDHQTMVDRDKIEQLRAVLREDRKYLAGLCGCAASSGCGAAIRRAEIDRLLNSKQKADEAKIRALVDEQAADEGLWFEAETCAEAYVQQALRRLHAVIEGKSRVDGEQVPRCKVTNNPVGADTWVVGYECSCESCQKMLRDRRL